MGYCPDFIECLIRRASAVPNPLSFPLRDHLGEGYPYQRRERAAHHSRMGTGPVGHQQAPEGLFLVYTVNNFP